MHVPWNTNKEISELFSLSVFFWQIIFFFCRLKAKSSFGNISLFKHDPWTLLKTAVGKNWEVSVFIVQINKFYIIYLFCSKHSLCVPSPLLFCKKAKSEHVAVWQNGIMKKSCVIKSSVQKKWHPLTFIDTCWMLTETTQRMDASTVRVGWCISAVATETWKTRHIPDSHAHLSHHKIKSILISSSERIGWLWSENCAQRWISASMN